MALLKKAVNEQAFLKAGFLGFPGSGKSFTSSMLAIGIAKQLADGKPVAFFDTEAGSDFLIPKFEAAGIELLRVKSKAFRDLLDVGKEAEQTCSVLIVDSITHVWNEACESYLKKVNEGRKKRRLPDLKKLEFQHWADVKRAWSLWTALYLNSRLHVIVCGRAGYEYEFVQNEDTQKNELQKVGTKMRVEGEFGFEPSLLVEMERASRGSRPGAGWIHRAHILKDRTDRINGKAFDFEKPKANGKDEWDPVIREFGPVLKALNIGGAHMAVDESRNSEAMFDSNGDTEDTRRGKRVQIAIEELQGIQNALWPGQDAKSKAARNAVTESLFDTLSWTAIESMNLERLERGVGAMKELRQQIQKSEEPLADINQLVALAQMCRERAREEAEAAVM